MMPHHFLVFVIFMFVLFALRSKYNTMSYMLTHFPFINKLLCWRASPEARRCIHYYFSCHILNNFTLIHSTIVKVTKCISSPSNILYLLDIMIKDNNNFTKVNTTGTCRERLTSGGKMLHL